MSCHKNKYNLFFINKYDVDFNVDNDTINISDNDVNISLNKSNKIDTVIFQGQANDNVENNYIGLFQLLEYYGYYLINPIDTIQLASSKFLSSIY